MKPMTKREVSRLEEYICSNEEKNVIRIYAAILVKKREKEKKKN